MFKPLKLAGYATLALSLFAASAQARLVEKTFNVADGGTLKLDVDRGSIHINSHKSNQVLVEVEIDGKNEEDMEVKFDSRGNDVSISAEHVDQGKGFWGSSRIKVAYRVTVPINYNLDLETDGGSIRINDLNGKVDAHTSGGSITLGRVDGMVDVRTSGGSIKVEEVTGTIRAHTSGGSIKAKLSKQPTGDSQLTTSGGSITVYLTQDIAVDLMAKTGGGRVKSEFEVKGENTKRKIHGTINGGGPKLVLKTSGGSVKIKQM